MLLLAIASSIVTPIALSALRVGGTGFDVQGRHVLPVAVVVPLLAGEFVFDHRARLSVSVFRAGLAGICCAVGVVHFTAWYWNARRQGVVEDGGLWFINLSEWSPPGGWWPCLIAALAGSVILSAVAGRGGGKRSAFARERYGATTSA